ncbi:MAG: phytanoyl-CoA dioxygenase family protein [Armatimonadetes bacterium]|nr:phytanoyl-CoA dioxygenase family protein [Armatimonadota bacterium]
MLNDAQVEFFRDNGYLVLDTPVLEADQIEEMKERVLQVTRGEKSGADSVSNLVGDEIEGSDHVVVQIVNIWQADPLFHNLIYQANITEMVSQLMGEDTVRLWHDQIQYKPPRVGAPTDWHQDHPYWPIIQPADLVSCWVALDNASIENGCMNVVPRSHNWGAVPGGLRGNENFQPTFDDESFLPADARLEVVPCEVKSGCCMFHHCLTWHGTYYNRSDIPRRAVALHYMPGYTRYEPDGRGHLVEEYVEVQPGEVLRGRHFPTVRENGQALVPGAVTQSA